MIRDGGRGGSDWIVFHGTLVTRHVDAPHAFAAEGQVVDGQGNLVANFESHARRLKVFRRGKKFFQPATVGLGAA